MPEIDLHTRVTQVPDLLTADLEDELVMMSLASDVYVSLDTLSKRIWSILHRPLTVAELCQDLLAEFDVPADICERDVLRLLNQLHEYRLIRIVPSLTG